MTQPEQPAPPAPPAAPPPAPPPAAAQPLPPPAPPAVAPVAVATPFLSTFRPPSWLGLASGGWRGTIALAASIALLVLGTQIINAAIPTPTKGPQGPGNGDTGGAGVTVAKRVVVHPASGWTVEGTLGTIPGIRLTRGDVSLDVRETTWTEGGPATFLDSYIARIIKPDTTQFDLTSAEATVVANQYKGIRATYVGLFKGVANPIEGQMTGVVFKDGLAIVFDAWAPQGSLTGSLADIKTMIDTTEVGQ